MEASPVSTETASILLVDDEESIRRLLKHYLGTRYTCAVSASAEEAQTALAAKRYQLVIADIGLPGSSGLELCESIKKAHPDTVVMMITGLAEAQYARQAMAAGAFSFLSKPIDFARLGTLVEDALKHQAILVQRRRRANS